MITVLRAVFFAAIAIAFGWYAWRAIVAGKIMIGIPGIDEFWFDRREDPFTFWVAVSFVAFVTILVGMIALGTVFSS